VPSLASNGTHPVNVNVTIPTGRATGQNYVWVILDVNSSAGQGAANEGNDRVNRPFNVTGTPPDLVVQNFSVSPSSGPAGTSVNVTFTIRNTGGGAAAPSRTNLRLATSSGNVTTGDPLLTSIDVPSLASNGTHPVNVNVTIPTGRATGQNYVWVILDVNSSAGQGAANEGNDRVNRSFMIIPPPQPVLSVTPATPTARPAAGGTIRLNVNNEGGGTMSYSANVTSGSPWLSITSGSSGGNSGTIVVSYAANPSDAQRSGTIEIVAPGASGSPMRITIAQAGVDGETVLLPGAISYIRQINNSDIHPGFNSSAACGPASAVMILTYYNRLTPRPMIGKSGQNNDYSWYVAPVDQNGNPSSTAYSFTNFSFNVGMADPAGQVNYGAHGWLIEDINVGTVAYRAVQYFWKHGLWATFDGSPTEAKVRTEIDAGRPVFLSVHFSSGGHILVVRGHNATQLITADPWVRSDLANRENYAYTWDQLHYPFPDDPDKWMIKSLSPVAAGGRVRATGPFNIRPNPDLAPGTFPMTTTDGLGTVMLDASLNSTFWNADGHTWVKVSWDSGQTGWTAIGDTGGSRTLWIEPVSAPPGEAPTITTSSPLPSGAVGAAYSQTLAATGGTTPYTWSLSAGILPAGLSLSGGGVISGTPGNAATASFTVQVSGNDGRSSTKAFGMTINPAPPPLENDQCAGAIALVNDVARTLNTADATSTGDPTPPCGSGFGKGVWYAFTPATSGQVTIKTCGSSFDTILSVYTGTCGSLTALPNGCNDDDRDACPGSELQSSVSFIGTAGTTYRILVGGYNGESGNLQIVATTVADPQPRLGYSRQGNQIVLSWPAIDPDFRLEYATQLPPASRIPGPVSPPVVDGGYRVSETMTNQFRVYWLKK
jgi:hypothetical protein